VVGTNNAGKPKKESRPIEYEAEDLFSREFQERFAASLAGEIATEWKEIAPGLDRLECDRADTGEFKHRFIEFVAAELRPKDAERWEKLIRAIASVLR
jgi:hypothetical protein